MLETPRTTCVACIVQSNYAYWAHVGDSRLYLFRQGGLIGQTKDHSKVQYLVDQGLIGAHEVVNHPDRNKIFSCLGGLVEPVIDLSRRTPLRNGDLIVMCTDGLWSVYPQEEIARALTGAPILKSLPVLMREAEVRGGDEGDNLSLIVVRWGPETLTDEPTTTITETMGLGEFQTEIDRTLTLTDRKGMQRDLTDDEIERAIAEIQATIKRYKTLAEQHAAADPGHRNHRPRPEGPSHHRDRRGRADRSPRRPAAPCTSTSTPTRKSTPARPKCTACRGKCCATSRSSGKSPTNSSPSHAARSGSSTTPRSTSPSSTRSSRAWACRPAPPSPPKSSTRWRWRATSSPGKRNNLDALCERFGVANAHRTLHGALLDAQLLAEVYLAMTRGQESLTIDIVTPRSDVGEGFADAGPLQLILVSAFGGRARRAPRLPGRARSRRQGGVPVAGGSQPRSEPPVTCR